MAVELASSCEEMCGILELNEAKAPRTLNARTIRALNNILRYLDAADSAQGLKQQSEFIAVP